ncbi:hypothetical protein CRENBAI_021202 [Crenichthys baileyi]|uniref:Uncharacterized protein n=1 Tax=Crenichthys baileyi TaxID=28760 RepID=A0AAV9REM9_9TELE
MFMKCNEKAKLCNYYVLKVGFSCRSIHLIRGWIQKEYPVICLSSKALQFRLGVPKVLPGQKRGIVPTERSGSGSGSLVNLQREVQLTFQCGGAAGLILNVPNFRELRLRHTGNKNHQL